MRHATSWIASILLGLVAAACASSNVPALATTYEADLGRASRSQLSETLPRIIQRYGYEIERLEDHQSTMYLYTKWWWREPFDDEVTMGYSQASTRLTVEARAIGRAWRVRLRAENRLMRAVGSEWEQPALTEMCNAYLDQIAQDLKREFESRFR